MTEREVMQLLNTLWEAGIRWDLPWKLSDSDDRRYVTRRAQKALYDHTEYLRVKAARDRDGI